MILAAIDIGSNAARLLITEVTQDATGKAIFNKLNLLRIPLRLGFDVFDTGQISSAKKEMLTETMQSFRHFMNAYKVSAFKACATSAMRDAGNAKEIIDDVLAKTAIPIEIIDGDTEANLIYENHVAENMDRDHSYLYIDVGGGSTEVSFFSSGILVFKRSFDIGTIRMLKKMVKDDTWDEMKNTVKAVTKGHKEVMAIGSGGNINKIFTLSKRKDGKPMPAEVLRDYLAELEPLTVQQRIDKYGFRDDRADVIVPALQIYLGVMRWANASEITVPKIGLADGLVQHLWAEMKTKQILETR